MKRADGGRRIGLFGGSFDPVHVGHRRLADAALAQLGLDELRWVVAGRPWQKARELAPAEDRAAMVALAIADEPRHRLERCEIDRDGPSYTIETVTTLQSRWAAEHAGAVDTEPAPQWFLIIGQDQYANLDTWRDWPQLLQRLTLAVAARDGVVPQAPAALAAVAHRVSVLALPPVPVSSTALRAALRSGISPDQLVPEQLAAPVAAYLGRRGLYHPDPADLAPASFPPHLRRS